ncbi:chitosanase, partial [[Kitasatospora] papulosa]|uniref:chitosanase n=1 Tax=[Kitasatospora] papulosa TaxID=1464011 RepID=UPI00381EC8B3
MHHPHTSTSRRTTRLTRTAGLAVLALGLAFTAIPATAQPGVPTSSAAHLEAAATGLDDPAKKDIAMQLVSSAENSTLDWKAQYGYIEDIGDGRGYTAGIIGFCSGTGDMLDLVELYTEREPGNALASYLPALREVDGTDSHEGLDPGFTDAWAEAASDPAFEQAQNDERDRVYFDPAVRQGKADGLGTLGQFAYYDAIVMHGGGTDATSFGSIRQRALAVAWAPPPGGGPTPQQDPGPGAPRWGDYPAGGPTATPPG